MSLMTHPLYQPEIVHGVPGRLRIRVPSLQTSPDLKATLEAQVKATPAVETVRVSVPTDCIIVSYRPQEPEVTQAQIYQLITQITQEFFAPNLNHQSPPEAVASEADLTLQEPEIAPPVSVSQTSETQTIDELEARVDVADAIDATTDTEISLEPWLSPPQPEVAATPSPTDTPELEPPTGEAPKAVTVIPGANVTESSPPDEPPASATTPPAKAPRRASASPRKPRTRKKPEPPAAP